MGINAKKTTVVLGIVAVVVVLFVSGVGGESTGTLYILYHSYFADVAIPFTFFFLLTLSEYRHAFLKPWWVKALLVFGLCTTSEIMQFFGLYALARVFDPLDIVMYGLGVLLAAALERGVFAAHLSFWE